MLRTGGRADQEGLLGSPPYAVDRPQAGELRFDGGDHGITVDIELVGRQGRHDLKGVFRVGSRQDVGGIHLVGFAGGIDGDGGHQVQAQQGQVGEVILGQRFAFKVRVKTAQPAQAAGGAAVGVGVGQHYLSLISHHEVSDFALTVDQHPHLAANFGRDAAQLAHQLAAGDSAGRDFASVNVLQKAQLACFKATGVAVNFFHGVGARRGPF